jgi:mono/diheme cytochrome c family protein
MKRKLLLVELFFGACSFGTENIESVDPDAIPAAPTYSEHIKPLMEFYCVACHDPEGQVGEAGGIDLTTYELVSGDYDDIREAIFDKRYMPPGGGRRLSAEDEATLARWDAQGLICGAGPDCAGAP